jgi:hypothetical protein
MATASVLDDTIVFGTLVPELPGVAAGATGPTEGPVVPGSPVPRFWLVVHAAEASVAASVRTAIPRQIEPPVLLLSCELRIGLSLITSRLSRSYSEQ